MTGSALKLLALIAMLLDHSAYVFYMNALIGSQLYIILRTIGRIAFPIYCYLLVQGFIHSSDRRKYFSRLLLLALISQLPFSFCLAAENYLCPIPGPPLLTGPGPLYIAAALLWLIPALIKKEYLRAPGLAAFILLPGMELRAGSYIILGGSMNVFYTLALSLALISLADSMRRGEGKKGELIYSSLCLIAALLLIGPRSDYGLNGAGLILLLYISREKKGLSLLFILLWAFLQYGPGLFFAAASAAVLPLLLYNGKRGPGLRFFFYGFYPLHLALLSLFTLMRNM